MPYIKEIVMMMMMIIIIIIITAIELSLGERTDKTSKETYTSKKKYKKHITNNTKHSQYKYTYYQN
jgi:hypothetical protein